MTVHDLVDKEQSEYLHSSFNAMYHGILDQLQLNLDERQLGLQRDEYWMGHNVKSKNKKIGKKMMEIAMKWKALDLGLKDGESMRECIGTESGDLSQCRALQRLHFVMKLFDEYFLQRLMTSNDGKIESEDVASYIDIVMQCLSDYNGIAMIDDLDHIRGRKNCVEDPIECPFGDGDGTQCIGEIMRKYRESEHGTDDIDESDDFTIKLKEYINGLDLKQRHLLETSTKIHSFLCHDVGDEKGADDELKEHSKRRPPNGRTEALNSKFVNEVQSEKISEKKEEGNGSINCKDM